MFAWFEKQLDPFPNDELKEPPKTLFAFCRHFTRGAEKPILATALLTALIAIIEISYFYFLGVVVDWLNEYTPGELFANKGWQIAGMLFMVAILPVIVMLQSLVHHQTVMGNYPMRIRWQVHRYLLNQSMSFYQDEFAGRIATKLMQTALAVRECVNKVFDVINYVCITFLGALVILLLSDLRLALPMLAWMAGYGVMLYYYIPRMGKVAQRQADARSIMTGRVVDSYTNIQTVKLFSHAGAEAAYSREGMRGFLLTAYEQMRLATGIWGWYYLLNATGLLAVASVSIGLWMSGDILAGAVAVALGMFLRFAGMGQWIMWELSMLFEEIGTVRDGMNSISLPRLVQDKPDAQPLPKVNGAITFDHVRFHYGKDQGVIEDLSLSIKPGEKVGLVGRSGAGKSTLVNLLLRFYDIESGRILIDGQDISTVTQDSLRAQIGMVTQDTSLLHRSLADNIRYGAPDASDAQLQEAIKRAEAESFITALKDPTGRTGLEAHVGERGVKLSGGQRQRIAIARVMLKDAPVLILDEATSALDSEVEEAIQQNLYRLMEGKTVIAIAHRLSTIAAMDRLIVLDAGNIIEQGSHDELVARGGVYASLWQRQSGGFLFKGEDNMAAAE